MADPARADELDENDPLASFRDRFVEYRSPSLIYLDGNSLGRLPKATAARLTRRHSRGMGRRAGSRLGPLDRHDALRVGDLTGRWPAGRQAGRGR